jgi:AbrB family transcriptional regulator (stage V sporulation protein T)
MEETKVTEKFQVTIPKNVRDKMGLKPGEIMIVKSVGGNEVRLKRFKVVKNPIQILVGKKKIFDEHIPIEDLEKKIESE